MPEENNYGSRAPRKAFPPDSAAPVPDSVPDVVTVPDSARDTRLLETWLLRLLCQMPAGAERWEIFEQFLSAAHSYRWRTPEHEVIFQALARFPQLSGIALRAVLPAQLTRAGFPDIDIAPYCAPLDLRQDEQAMRAKQIVAALIANPISK